jgi:lycopene beta-cyclase
MAEESFPKFDIIVIGDGLSGWLLLEELSKNSSFATLRILLLSNGKEEKRSWCLWENDVKSPLRELVQSSWQKLAFQSKDFNTTQSLKKLQYHYIPGKAFFKYYNNHFIPRHPNITLVYDTAVAIKGGENAFVVEGENDVYQGFKVYNSAFLNLKLTVNIWQHFRGWFIETKSPVFKPDTAVLMDFNVPQNKGCSFMYTLPLSETSALIELTYFSGQVLEPHEYDSLLAQYITEHFGDDYKIVEKEQGKIPMQQGVFNHFGAAGEINLGTLSGMVKASTGYAFQRIRHDSVELARSYYEGRKARRVNEKGRFAFYDALLLWIILHRPQSCRYIFTCLFKYRKIELILRFMDQQTNIWQELGIFIRLPIGIFLKALFFHVFPSKGKKVIEAQLS